MNRWPESVRAHQDVVTQTVGEDLILLNLKTGVYWGLNRSGAFIWEELSRLHSPRQTLASLRTRYAADESELKSALTQLLEQLLHSGLLIADGAPGPKGRQR